MERRVLLAIFLSFLVLYAYQAFFARPVPKPADTPIHAGTSTGRAEPPGAEASPARAPHEAAPRPAAAAVIGDSTERDIRIETPQIVATFTNRGARLKSWRLKKYQDRKGAPLELVATD